LMSVTQKEKVDSALIEAYIPMVCRTIKANSFMHSCR
jgi:hypothetical protein